MSISRHIANFAADLRYGDIPEHVAERAKLLILDGVGIAFASTTFEFSKYALAALSGFGEGGSEPVIGFRNRLPLRDAALMNGILVHGLDYDDTHLASVCHTSASALPVALAMASRNHLSGRDLLAGYILAVEVSARIGMAAHGGFHTIGFHPTGLTGAFGCAVAAAKLDGLAATGIANAQGFVGSSAGGLMEFLDDGSWTKRSHPGLAAANGITAAAFARQGWPSPPAVYEGRFGLFATHLQGREVDLAPCTAGLGEVWEVLNSAVKPYPACHFTHAFADAALVLARKHNLTPESIARIDAYIHPTAALVVCQPEDKKRTPTSDYDAKFSLPFVVAASFSRGRFGMAELEPQARSDREILDLADRVFCHDDPGSGYPAHYSGELRVETTDGQRYMHREQINRGARERPLTGHEIIAKYRENMAVATSADRAARVEELLLGVEDVADASVIAEALRG